MRLPPPLMRATPLVLVVDDDRLMRTMARDTLEQEGWAVIEAEDGTQALERFGEDYPDLVLMDDEMPVRDGISACREIRERYPDDPTPVLILTGAEDRGCIERAYEAGATDFASKPPNWTILSHRVRFLLRASRDLRELHRSQALLADAQRLAQVGYWCWNAQTGQMEWSDEIYRIFGLEPRSIEPNPRNWWKLMHPDDRGEVRQRARAALSSGGHYAVEHRLLLDDDAVKHVHQHAEMAQSERGAGRWLVGTLQDVTEQRQAQEEIRYLANFDGLTGLANRRHFLDSLALALEDARAADEFLALMYLDLDGFKQVNDSLGHAAGDELLRQVAEVLRSHVRASDMVGRLARSDPDADVSRLGGDEFTILLRGLSSSDAAGEVAHRILRDLPRVVRVEDRGIAATASVGIALFPEDGEDAETLMKNADTAMYHAKENGRNSCQFFCTSMNRNSERRLHVEAALRRALDFGGLELHYQPRIDLRTGRPVGLEALLRWTDPELGRVSPVEALEVAQDAGLMERVGEWNFETACAQICTWQARGFEPLPVAVNVGPEQFARGELYATLTGILRRTGVKPQLIEVEITEHAVLRDDEQVAATLRDLRAIGIRVALDDFGTGYSSLGYLTRLPLDLLKLDRSFIRDVCGDGSASGVVRGIIDMCKSLGLRVVAEGVDAEEQAAALRELGCDELQGFLVSPAVPGEDAEIFLSPRSQPE
jgi:diguanylate cyclase (GGDEF)-like protein/PAS domain S-box-containing protein